MLLAFFCFVSLVTWCHCVCFSCYLRQNGGTINVSKFEDFTSRLCPHIPCCSVKSGASLPYFTHRFTQNAHKSETGICVQICKTFRPILYEFRTSWSHIALFHFPTALNAFRHLNMSQTLSQLPSWPAIQASCCYRHASIVSSPPSCPSPDGGGDLEFWGPRTAGCSGLGSIPMGCVVLGRGAEAPRLGGLSIWLEAGLSHVTWVHYDATMCLPCPVCSVLLVLHFLRFGLFVF